MLNEIRIDNAGIELPFINRGIIAIRDCLFFYSLAIFLIKRLFVDVALWRSFPWFDDFRDTINDIYDHRLVNLLLVCIAISFFSSVPKLRRIFLFSFMIYLGNKVSSIQDNMYFYLAMLLILAAYRVSAKRILIFCLSLNIPALIVTVVASQIGVIENRIELGRDREYLGYTWTTTPVMIFAYGVFAYLVLRRGKIKIIEYITLNVINFWFFYKTNTRFAFLLVFLLLTIMYLYQYWNSRGGVKVLLGKWVWCLPWISFATVYLSSVLYDPNNALMKKVNNLLSMRLVQCCYSLSIYHALPWGQPIEWVSTGAATADNPATYVDTAYLQSFLKYGWVSIIVLMLLSTLIILRSIKEKKYYLCIVFCCVLVFGLFEQQLYWFEYDIILLLVFANWDTLEKNQLN